MADNRNGPCVSPRALCALHIIKHSLTADNDLALKVSNTGSLVVAHHIDDLVNAVMRMETELIDNRSRLDLLREEIKEYCELLDGYPVDLLNDEEKAELRALVEKWRKADEGD